MKYKTLFLDKGLLKDRLFELSSLGLKSVMYAGEGEPLLHKDIGDIINCTKKAGLDVAITTNGVLLNKGLVDRTLGKIEWIKVSINGATRQTYAKIHRAKPDDFDRVIKNISYAARLKRKNGYSCTLGMQLVLLPENYKEAAPLARIAKDIGIDYLVVKPYSQHPFSITTIYKDIKYNDYFKLKDKLNKFNDGKFNVIFRIHTMKKWDEGTRNYKHCYALPFWTYIDAAGNVWGCSVYLSDNRFLYGNIYKDTFKKIWNGSARKKSVKFAEKKLNINKCRVNCRMDEINRYLWELKNPPEHINFI